MQNSRTISMELVHHGAVKEYTTVSAKEAKELINKTMANGYRWRITLPDETGELPHDEKRYARDCEACGVENCFA